MSKAAIFWDRDGTLIDDPGYLRDVEKIRVLPGAAAALRKLSAAGFEHIIASNQSGVARGLMDEATVEAINERLCEMLSLEGAGIEAVYYCPYLDGPEAVVDQYRLDSDLRKPKPGMLVKASLERDIDLAASWSIGDKPRDAEAGRAAGCRTILIDPSGSQTHVTTRHTAVDFVARSLEEAADIVLKYTTGAGVNETSRSTPSKPSAAPASPGAASTSSSARENPAPSQSTPSREDASPSSPASTDAILRDILALLQRLERAQRAEDFSVPRLAGVILQMATIMSLIWAAFALNEPLGTQLVRLTWTLVLQVMTLTMFTIGRKKQ